MADRIVKVVLRGDAGSYISAARSAERETGRLGASTKRVGASASHVYRNMAAGVAALGLGKVIKDSIQLEARYSTTMRQIGVATGAAGKELDGLDKLAVKLGANTVFSANEAADAMLELAKGGLKPAQIEAGALKNTLTLATAGGMQLSDAASTVVRAMGAFQLKAKDSGAAVAALAGAANASSADVSDIAQALAQAGTSAHAAGLSVQETTAFLAAFSNAGINGSDAGTSLKTMLQRLVPQTKAAGLEMEHLGLKFTDANGQFVDAEQIAGRLQKAFKGMSQEERTRAITTIFGSDAQRAANVLIQEGAKGVRKYEKATNDQTQAQKLSKAAMGGTAGALEQMRGSFETAELQLGRGLAPTVQKFANELSDFISHHDLEAWGKKAGRGLRNVIDDAKPFAREVGHALVTVGDAIGHVADGFNSLPKSVQQAIVTGSIVAVGAHKLGADSLARGALKGLTSGAGKALGGSVASRLAPVPVVVMNKGFDSLLGKGGAAGELGTAGKVATGATAAEGGVLATLADIPLAPTLIALGSGYFLANHTPVGKFLGKNAPTVGPGGPASTGVIDAQMPGIVGTVVTWLAAHAGGLKPPADGPSAPPSTGGGNPITGALNSVGAMVKQAEVIARLRDELKKLPKSVRTQVETPGLLHSVQSVKVLADQYRLTPRQIITALSASGVVRTIADVKKAQRTFDLTPKQVVTLIKASGVDLSKSDVRELQRIYDLTPKQVSTMLKAIDYASQVARNLRSIYGGLPREVVTNIVTNHVDKFERVAGAGAHATGGYISGPGTATSDSIPAWLSNGEYVVRAAAVAKYGVDTLNRINAMAYASGGPVGRTPAPTVVTSGGSGMPSRIQLVIGGRAFDAHVREIAGDEYTSRATYARAAGGRG